MNLVSLFMNHLKMKYVQVISRLRTSELKIYIQFNIYIRMFAVKCLFFLVYGAHIHSDRSLYFQVAGWHIEYLHTVQGHESNSGNLIAKHFYQVV